MSIFSYKGVDLAPFLNVLKIERTVGNERNISTMDGPKLGVNVQEVTFGPKIIKVKVSMASRAISPEFVDTITPQTVQTENLNKLREQVSSLLHAEEAFELKLPDEPDRYYMALPRGDIELEGITTWYDETTIEFFVPDGVAHSTSYKRFDMSAARVTGNKAVFTLQNNGNQPAFPIVTFRHNDENGYIGMVNQTAAIEVGDIEEDDGVVKQKSKVLRDYKTGTNIISGLDHATKNVAVYNSSQNLNGTVAILNLWGRPHMHLSNRGGTTGNNGGSVTWFVPADTNGEVGALNDYIWWRQIFWAGSVEQYGMMKLTVSDTDGNFLYAIETIKRSKGLATEYNVITTDGEGGYDVIKRFKFKATHKDTENPFNQDRGFCDVLRRNDRLQVYFWGKYHKLYVPEIRGKKTGKFHFIFSGIGNKPLVTHMYLDQIMYRKDFISTFYELPNQFSAGSTVVLNSETDTVMQDNILANNKAVHGSEWPEIPVGKSNLEITVSDWAQMPDITVNFEERWL